MITLFCLRPKAFNVGNDAIFCGLRYFIQEAFGRVVNLVTLPATTRYESHSRAGLTAKSIFEINQYAQGVIVGGGNLYENGELDVNLDALERLQVPLLLFSLSRGRIYDRRGQLVERTDAMSQNTIRALNRKAFISLTRDQATQQHLQGLGITNSLLGGCPTIFLDRTLPTLPKLPTSDEQGVLISIRNPELMNIPMDSKVRVHQQIADMIRYLHGQGHQRVRLLCHDHRDIPFAASFPGLEYVYTDDVGVFLALLKAASLVISFRVHAALPCLAFGTPMIVVSYDERALSLIDTIGFGAWNIDLMRSPDVVGEVIDRHGRLDDLNTLRLQAQPTWKRLYRTMFGALQSFAEQIAVDAAPAMADSLLPLRKSA